MPVDGARLRALLSEDHDFGCRVLKTVHYALGQRLESTRIQLAAAVCPKRGKSPTDGTGGQRRRHC